MLMMKGGIWLIYHFHLSKNIKTFFSLVTAVYTEADMIHIEMVNLSHKILLTLL